MESRTVSLVHPGKHSRRAAVSEIRLAAASPPSGFLPRLGRRLWEIAHKRRVTAGTVLITEAALVLDAQAGIRGRMDIPWDTLRKAAVDDGARWGHVSGFCRFPVYDARSDGSGSGILIGPLWSQGSSLMPAGCPVASLDPVPLQAPNVVLIFEPRIPDLAASGKNGSAAPPAVAIAGLLLRADDAEDAREALASRTEVGDVDHDDLAYLSRSAGLRSIDGGARSGASANGASANGASATAS